MQDLKSAHCLWLLYILLSKGSSDSAGFNLSQVIQRTEWIAHHAKSTSLPIILQEQVLCLLNGGYLIKELTAWFIWQLSVYQQDVRSLKAMKNKCVLRWPAHFSGNKLQRTAWN